MLRNQSVYGVYRKMIVVAVMLSVVTLLNVITAVHLASKRIPPEYIPITDDGVLIKPIPLSQPNQTISTVSAFALDAVRALNTYDYINWRDQLQAASTYFTVDGWNDYEALFQAADTIKAVEDRRMIVSVKPTGEVTVIAHGLAPNGLYAWRVEVPVDITYTAHVASLSGSNQQRGVITLYIVRTPTTVNPKGIGIRVFEFRSNDKLDS